MSKIGERKRTSDEKVSINRNETDFGGRTKMEKWNYFSWTEGVLYYRTDCSNIKQKRPEEIILVPIILELWKTLCGYVFLVNTTFIYIWIVQF